MKILLTGSKGHIGRHLEFELTKDYGPSGLQAFDEFGDKEKWTSEFRSQVENGYVECDRLLIPKRFDVVIHAGAISYSGYASEDIFWWNYHCTRKIAEYAQDTNAKLIFFSSCVAIEPTSLYAWSKRCAEDYLLKSLPGQCCVLRPYRVFGQEEGRESEYSPVSKLVRNELEYVFDPWIRDYIHVLDVVRAVKYVIKNQLYGNEQSGAAYDLGTGKGVSTKELVEIWGQNPLHPIVKPGDPQWPAGAPEKLVARKEWMIKGFTPDHNVKEWLMDLVDYSEISVESPMDLVDHSKISGSAIDKGSI